MGCSPWGRKELDTTERLPLLFSLTGCYRILSYIYSLCYTAGPCWVIYFIYMHWRRKWQPTPVFLPGESQGPGSLVGCRLWGRIESDRTEVIYNANSSAPGIYKVLFKCCYPMIRSGRIRPYQRDTTEQVKGTCFSLGWDYVPSMPLGLPWWLRG